MAFFCIFQLEKMRMEEQMEKMEEGLRRMKFPGMKAWYLRLDRFLQMTRNLLAQEGCDRCRVLAEEALELSGMTVEDKASAEMFEEKYVVLSRNISDHLKEVHGYRMPNHYLSLYTLVFMIAGTLGGLLVVFLGRAGHLGEWSWQMGGLLGFVAGLVTGRITGNRKDRQMSSDGKRIYE